MYPLIIISTTFENKKDGEKLSRSLLDEKLIACAQLSGPITSYYRWEGDVAASTEFILTMKTKEPLYEKVKTRLKEMHPYELPEIIVQAVPESSEEYMQWVEDETLK